MHCIRCQAEDRPMSFATLGDLQAAYFAEHTCEYAAERNLSDMEMADYDARPY